MFWKIKFKLKFLTDLPDKTPVYFIQPLQQKLQYLALPRPKGGQIL